ncbi:MAG TPA: signal peptide peptidase SppA [Candidatus Binataceae bacterium]|nr:signal peptide peptidase SppA [Candidatus Binataceae bacterium]
MTKSSVTLFFGRRVVRVSIYCAILLLMALLAAYFGRPWPAAWLVFAAIATAVLFFLFVIRPARIPRDAVLTIRLSGSLPEEPHRSVVDQLRGRAVPPLSHLRHALTEVGRDSAVRALIIEVAGIENGLATAEELHDLIRQVRESGKRVIAVLDSDFAGERDYLVASAADEVVCNPDTALAMLGVTAGGVFVKRALDKLHVGVQTLQYKEYKGAAETFSRESMSGPLRESLEAIIADWRRTLTERIAQARKLSIEKAAELVGHGFMTARDARDAGLIDREGYSEDLRAEFDPEGKRKKFIGLARYLRHTIYVNEGAERSRIAVVCGVGPVIAGDPAMSGEFISPETTGAQIEHASRDEQVKAIVFRVNSPGGSAVGSDLVWRSVRAAQRRGKPVVVSMGDVAGSGGYYVAMGADAIVAEPSTITGSIGVVYAKFDLSSLMDHFGINIERTRSHAISDAMSPTRAMTEAELHQLDGVIGHLYGNFTAKVAEGRKLDAQIAESLARGRVWTGAAAKARGLIDDVGGMARAIEIAREKAGIAAGEAHELVSYSEPRLMTVLRSSLNPGEPAMLDTFASKLIGAPARWMPALLHLLLRGGVMMLGPFIEL